MLDTLMPHRNVFFRVWCSKMLDVFTFFTLSQGCLGFHRPEDDLWTGFRITNQLAMNQANINRINAIPL